MKMNDESQLGHGPANQLRRRRAARVLVVSFPIKRPTDEPNDDVVCSQAETLRALPEVRLVAVGVYVGRYTCRQPSVDERWKHTRPPTRSYLLKCYGYVWKQKEIIGFSRLPAGAMGWGLGLGWQLKVIKHYVTYQKAAEFGWSSFFAWCVLLMGTHQLLGITASECFPMIDGTLWHFSSCSMKSARERDTQRGSSAVNKSSIIESFVTQRRKRFSWYWSEPCCDAMLDLRKKRVGEGQMRERGKPFCFVSQFH